MNFIMIYKFCPKQRKLKKSKNLWLICMIKKELVIHIRNLNQALNHGLVFLKNYKVIKFNQKTWLK